MSHFKTLEKYFQLKTCSTGHSFFVKILCKFDVSNIILTWIIFLTNLSLFSTAHFQPSITKFYLYAKTQTWKIPKMDTQLDWQYFLFKTLTENNIPRKWSVKFFNETTFGNQSTLIELNWICVFFRYYHIIWNFSSSNF